MRRKLKKITVYDGVITTIMSLGALLCLLPMINVLAESLSANANVIAGDVSFWPVGFTFNSYVYVLKRWTFWNAMVVSICRVLLGGIINVALCALTGYPLSKTNHRFKMRTFYAWFVFFTCLFSGGLIPWYVTIKELRLLDTIWALVLPGAVPVFNVLLMLNYYRGIPVEMEEAAVIDGAGEWRIWARVILPISVPALATIAVFSLVNHWNSWFDGIVLMNRIENQPLSSYLRVLLYQSKIIQPGAYAKEELSQISEHTLQAAQVFIAIIPIMLAYPFMQKHFVKGIMLGGVKA